MCGICGKIYFSQDRKVTEQEIQKMNETIKHRGPDDSGVYINPIGNVGLGHRRLSIIDLSPLGHNPMCNEDQTVWIVFNGEIYNFQSLKPDLEKKGHKFKSNTDTEVIIHLWEEYREDCLKYLRGMFSFAIWDEKRKIFFAARDRVGKKPFKYYFDNNCFIFASELKAILVNPEVKKEPDFEAIHHYLTLQYIPHPLTGFKNIWKLPQAHYILICDAKENLNISSLYKEYDHEIKKIGNKKMVIGRYWELDYTKKLNISENEWCEKIRDKLDECVKLRMISDVPLGAFLSGGIDSSAVVAFMAKNSTKPIKTFSIGFEEPDYDERKYAKLTAGQYQTEHRELLIKPEKLEEVLDKLVYAYEEPYADSSALATYYLAKMTRDYVTVTLNGDGGDENFGGYPQYPIIKFSTLYEKIPALLRNLILQGTIITRNLWPNTFFDRCHRFAKTIEYSLPKRYLNYICYFNAGQKDKIYSSKILHNEYFPTEKWIEKIFNQAKAEDLIDKILYLDFNTYLPNDLMVKVDIATMMVSLEGRSPLLDHEFIELTSQIPSNLKVRGINKKYIFKKALKGIVPEINLTRKKKGFGVPIEHWFRGDFKEYCYEELLDEKFLKWGIFNQQGIKSLLEEYNNSKINYAPQIWALLTLKKWLDLYF